MSENVCQRIAFLLSRPIFGTKDSVLHNGYLLKKETSVGTPLLLLFLFLPFSSLSVPFPFPLLFLLLPFPRAQLSPE